VATHDLAWFSSSHSFPSKSTPPFQLPSGTCDQKVVFSELSVGAKKELWISTVESELQWFIQQLFNAWDGIFLHIVRCSPLGHLGTLLLNPGPAFGKPLLLSMEDKLA